ncbi:MAG TPA: hypothetical protein VFK50_04810 [Sphingomicrobium sp.]|nr:hypothetical protein [Sphingomicrobium sp.]
MLAACAATAPPVVDQSRLPPIIVEPLIVPPAPVAPRFTQPGQAVDAVLAVHPELRPWRTLTIPPQSIQAVRYQPGAWLVAFLRTSGNDILAARCFRVLPSGAVLPSGVLSAREGHSITYIDVGACRADPDGRASRDDSRPRGIGWQVNGRSAYFYTAAKSQFDLAILCDPGGPVSLYLYTNPGPAGPTIVELQSGGLSARVASVASQMRASPPPVGYPTVKEPVIGMELRSQLPLDSTLMTAFLTTGRLTVSGLGKTVTADAAPLERRALQALAQACR